MQLLGQLQRGQPVTTSSGRVIQPADVMDPPMSPGASVLVVDCPDVSYLPALAQAAAVKSFVQTCEQQAQQASVQQQEHPQQQQQPATACGPSVATAKPLVVVHMAAAAVISSPEYQSWLSQFGPCCTHLLVSADGQLVTTTRAAAALQGQLNVLEPDVFRLDGFREISNTLERSLSSAHHNGSTASTAAGGSDSAHITSLLSKGVSLPDDWQSMGLKVTAGTDSTGSIILSQDQVKYKLSPARYYGLDLSDIRLPAAVDAIQSDVRVNHPKVMQLLQEYQYQKQQMLQGAVPPQLQGIDR